MRSDQKVSDLRYIFSYLTKISKAFTYRHAYNGDNFNGSNFEYNRFQKICYAISDVNGAEVFYSGGKNLRLF